MYKKVHTLAFAEISDPVLLNPTSLHSKYYIRKIPSITLLTLSKPIVNTSHGLT